MTRRRAKRAGKLFVKAILGGLAALLVLSMFAGCATKAPIADGKRIAVTRADELPRHSYAIDKTVLDLIRDDARFGKLVASVKADLEADHRAYDIRDATTLKDDYTTLRIIAMLDKDWDRALAYLAKVRELEDKPAIKLTAGLIPEAYIAARKADPALFEKTFRETLRRAIAALPYEEVDIRLKSVKGRMELFSENMLLGVVQESIEPAAQSGALSKELATSVIGIRYHIREILPIRAWIVEELGAAIAAHKVVKPDIWAARDVILDGRADLSPVRVAVWDTGSDPAVFPGRMFVNEKEVPDNGKDDDGNGFVDDVYGIAYTLKGDKTESILFEFVGDRDEVLKSKDDLKGFMDVTSAIDSPEADVIRRKMGALPKDEVKSFFENLGQYAIYAHGTHVAGIAAAGNPAIRIVVGRLTADHRMKPETPTLEDARKSAVEMRESVDYFRKAGVRVVNMSWGDSLRSVELALEQNNAGGTPEERKKLAREIFDISSKGLFEAMRDATDILFVTSAGNSNNDVAFDEFIPSSYDLPNLLTVGAVDQAGDETGFTSFGKEVDIYANGFEVDSFVPGGERMKMSGTSMSSPNVVNLAAKLLAVKPGLDVKSLREAILAGTDEREVSKGKVIRLMNPKKSFEHLGLSTDRPESAPAQEKKKQ